MAFYSVILSCGSLDMITLTPFSPSSLLPLLSPLPPGITPMLQIIKAILKDSKDTTRVSLLFANQVYRHAVSITYCSSSGIVC